LNCLLDTNICIYLIKNRPIEVCKKFERLAIGSVGISSVTTSELFYGVYKSDKTAENRQALLEFLLPLTIVSYDENAAPFYGEIRTVLEKSGQTIGPLDMMIAAHALSLGVTLVTNNIKEFQRVPELMVENWVQETRRVKKQEGK